MKVLTEEQYNIIEQEVDKYNDEKYGYIHIEYIDIIHTYFKPNEILNDWFEWASNDRYYSERWEHLCSEYRFIKELCEKITIANS